MKKTMRNAISSLTAKFAALLLTLGLVGGVWGADVAKIGSTGYETLAAAIADVGDGDVVIELLDDVTLNYGAREAYGTAGTTKLTIKGAGHTLTLNQTDSDWSSLGMKNADAVLAFENMTIDKTGYGVSGGAWNTHAIKITSKCEMTGVTVNHAIDVENDATLANVTINESGDYYALWITGEGQTVTVSNSALNAPAGRGVKIADQYVGAPESVTLNISDTTIKSAKKAAVLVSSTAGAAITAANVDISNVAADSSNIAWVDEDWSVNFDKVTVNGGQAYPEGGPASYATAVVVNGNVVGYYETIDDAINVANATAGDVTIEVYKKCDYKDASPSLGGTCSSIAFVGKTDAAEISITRNGSNGYISGTGSAPAVTFTGLKLSKSAGAFAGDAGFMNVAFSVYRVASVSYENCTFPNGACAAGSETTYKNCTFYKSHDGYELWAYGAPCTVDGCTFAANDKGKAIKMYAENSAKTTELTVKNSDFSAVDNNKPAIVLSYGKSVTLEGNTYSGKGVFELDQDKDPDGTTVTADIADIACNNDDYTDCGVLVDGKIYTTVTAANNAGAIVPGSTVTLFYSPDATSETAVLPPETTIVDNGYAHTGITVATYVAQVGETKYASLADAFAAAQSGDTVQMIADETLENEVEFKMADKATSVTLDLNGKAITRNGDVAIKAGKGVLTITDNSESGAGSITAQNNTIKLDQGEYNGRVEIKGGLIQAIDFNAVRMHNGNAIISGGTVKARQCAVAMYDVDYDTESDVEITGDAVIIATEGWTVQNCQGIPDNSSILISGGKIVNESEENPLFWYTAAPFEITGGTFCSKVADTADPEWDEGDGAWRCFEDAIADGYVKVAVTEPGYEWAYTIAAAVASITVDENTTYYATLEEAIVAANEDNVDEITILNGATESPDADWKVSGDKLVRKVYVAQIGEAKYETFAAALAAAQDGDTVTLISGPDVAVSATGEVTGGKTITVTGTAKFNWDIAWLMVGRGSNPGDGTLIFKDATITSSSMSTGAASYGINISGHEKGSSTKNDGTVIIDNSYIECRYLVDKGSLKVIGNGAVGATPNLVVLGGFDVCGRPANETESGEDATAYMELSNGAYVQVKNINGLGVGREGKGVVSITGGSKFEHDYDNGVFINKTKGTVSIDATSVFVGQKMGNAGSIAIDATGLTQPVKVIDCTNFEVTDLAGYGSVTVTSGEAYVEDGDLWVKRLDVAQIGATKYGTLAEAILAAADGATIEILDGTWGADSVGAMTTQERASVRGKSLTIQAAEGATPKFTSDVYLGYDDGKTANATMTVKGLSFENAKLSLVNYVQATVEDCSFTGSGPNAALYVSDSCDTTHLTADDYPADQVTIKNCTFDGTAASSPAIRIRNSGNVLIEGNTVENSSHNGILLESNTKVDSTPVKTVVIKDNTITEWNAGNVAGGGRGIRASLGTLAEGSTVTIEGNVFRKETLGLDEPDYVKISGAGAAAVDVSGNDWNDMLLSEVNNNGAVYTSDATTTTITSVITTRTEPVAQNMTTGTKYETLGAAFTAVNIGDTIQLLADVEQPDSINVMKSVTLDLNGHAIVATTSLGNGVFKIGNATAVFTIDDSQGGGKVCSEQNKAILIEGQDDGRKFVLKGGSIEAYGEGNAQKGSGIYTVNAGAKIEILGGSVYGKWYGISAKPSANLTIYTGSIKVADGTVTGGSLQSTGEFRGIWAGVPATIEGGRIIGQSSSTGVGIRCDAPAGSVTITGGSICALGNSNSASLVLVNGMSFAISGGWFAEKVTASSATAVPEEYCAEDYIPSEETRNDFGDGLTYHTVKLGVAKIGTKAYDSFAAAAAARTSNDDVITLIQNAEAYTMTVGETLKVAKNGKTFSTPTVAGAYVVKSSTADGVTTYTIAEADLKYTTEAGVESYKTWSSTVISGSGTYQLLKDVTATARIAPGVLASNIALDLNGHTLTSTATDYAILLSRAGSASAHKAFALVDTSAEKGGTLVVNSAASAAIQAQGKYNDITIGEGVTVDGGCVALLSENQTLNVSGTINGGSDVAIATNGSSTKNAVININDGAVLTSSSIAMYLPAAGTTTISGGSITGATAVYVKSGTLNVTGGTLAGTGAAAAYTYNGNGANATGDALVVDNCGYPGDAPEVAITGGTFSSTNGKGVGSYYGNGETDLALVTATSNEISIHDDRMWLAQEGGYKLVEVVVVTFVAEGAANVPEPQKIPKGGTAELPTQVPTKAYSAFDKWLLDGEVYDFNATVGANITLTASWADAVASVTAGDPAVTSYYATLAAAVAAVPADGTATTVTMIADSAEPAVITVAAEKNVVLDLNGQTVSYTTDAKSVYFITNKGTLTIVDNSANADGQILLTAGIDNSYSKECVTVFNVGGTLTLDSGTVKNATGGGLAYAVNNSSNAWGEDVVSTFNLAGGTISAPGGDAALRVYQNCSAKSTVLSKNYVNITGGTILDTGIFVDTVLYTANGYAEGFEDSIDTQINISGGTVNGLVDLKIRHKNNTKLTITGGDFTNARLRVRKYAGEYQGDEPTEPMVAISGGNFAFVDAASAFNTSTGWTTTSSWTTYKKPYAVSGGWFSEQVPAMACAEGFEPTGVRPEAPSPAMPYTVAFTADIVYPIEGTAGVPIALAWATDNTSVVNDGDVVTAADVSAIIEALSENGANGMPLWESYVLGLDPKSADAVLRLTAAPVAADGTQVAISAVIDKTKFPEIENVTVTFRLAEQNGDTWTNVEAVVSADDPTTFVVPLDSVAGKVLAIFADIEVR